MKRCPFCMEQDLHDEAQKCPHCGTWLSRAPRLHKFVEIIGWVFLVIFILALASCGAMLLFKR
jgi:hypothetical protein